MLFPEQRRVRIAGPADAATVSALLTEFNGEGLLPAALARRMAEVGGLETAFLGELEGEPAGVLVLRTVPALTDAHSWAEITEMYVRPGYRRQGVGTALIEAALAYGRACGCREVHLLVDPANEAGLSFYEAVGFRRDSVEMRRGL